MNNGSKLADRTLIEVWFNPMMFHPTPTYWLQLLTVDRHRDTAFVRVPSCSRPRRRRAAARQRTSKWRTHGGLQVTRKGPNDATLFMELWGGGLLRRIASEHLMVNHWVQVELVSWYERSIIQQLMASHSGDIVDPGLGPLKDVYAHVCAHLQQETYAWQLVCACRPEYPKQVALRF